MDIVKNNWVCTISNEDITVVIDDNYILEWFDVPDIIVKPLQRKVDIISTTTKEETAKKISSILTFFETHKPEIIKKTAKNIYELITHYCNDWLLEEQAKAMQLQHLEQESKNIYLMQDTYDAQRVLVQSLKQQIKHAQLQCSFYEHKMRQSNESNEWLLTQTSELYEEFQKQHSLFNEISQRIIEQERVIKEIWDQKSKIKRRLNRYDKMCLDRVSWTVKQKNKANNFIKKFEQKSNYWDLMIMLEWLRSDYDKQNGHFNKLKEYYETTHQQYINAQIEYVFNDYWCIDIQKQLYINDNKILELYEKINEQSQEELVSKLNELLIFEHVTILAQQIKILNKKAAYIIRCINRINEQKNCNDFEKERQIVQLNKERELIQQTLYWRWNENNKWLYQDLHDRVFYNEHTSWIVYFKEIQFYQDTLNSSDWRTAHKETNVFLRKGFEKLKSQKIAQYKAEVAQLRNRMQTIAWYKKEITQLQQENEYIISNSVKMLHNQNKSEIKSNYDSNQLQHSYNTILEKIGALKNQLKDEAETLQWLEWNILDEKKSFTEIIAVYTRKKKEFEQKLEDIENQYMHILHWQSQLIMQIKEDKQKLQQEKDQMEFKHDQKKNESDEDYSERKSALIQALQWNIQYNEKQRAFNKKELKNMRKKWRWIYNMYVLFASQIKEFKDALLFAVYDEEISLLSKTIITDIPEYSFLEINEVKRIKKTWLPPLVRQWMAGWHRSAKDYDKKVATWLRQKKK